MLRWILVAFLFLACGEAQPDLDAGADGSMREEAGLPDLGRLGRADVGPGDAAVSDARLVDAGPAPEVDADAMFNTIELLASPAHAGRLPGSDGIALSRAHILERLSPVASFVDMYEFILQVDGADATGVNLVVRLPGEGNLAAETVVVMAHYDHLGPADGDGYFAGAVDNAGGVAALIETVLGWQAFDAPHRRSLTAVFTDGEELGLRGARAWRDSLTDLDDVAAAVSVDGFGVLMGPSHTQGFGMGTDTAEAIHQAVLDANRSTEFGVLPLPSYVLEGRSDHAAFYERSVPVLHFVTGSPPEIYHTTADQSGVIDRALLAPAARWLSYFVRQLAVAERPAWDPSSERTCSDSAQSFTVLLQAFRADANDPALEDRIDAILPLIAPYAGFELSPPRQAQCDGLLRTLYAQIEAELIP